MAVILGTKSCLTLMENPKCVIYVVHRYRGQLIITTGQLPYPVLKNGTVKALFLFSICLLRAINLLNNAGNRLSLGIPKAVSVFPAEQGGKTLKSQNSFFWGLCAKWCFSIIIWSPGSQFIIINTIFDREHDAATFSLYRQSKYQLIERFNTIIVTRNCHFFWCKRIFKINQYHTVEGRFFVFIILIGP